MGLGHFNPFAAFRGTPRISSQHVASLRCPLCSERCGETKRGQSTMYASLEQGGQLLKRNPVIVCPPSLMTRQQEKRIIVSLHS